MILVEGNPQGVPELHTKDMENGHTPPVREEITKLNRCQKGSNQPLREDSHQNSSTVSTAPSPTPPAKLIFQVGGSTP